MNEYNIIDKWYGEETIDEFMEVILSIDDEEYPAFITVNNGEDY